MKRNDLNPLFILSEKNILYLQRRVYLFIYSFKGIRIKSLRFINDFMFIATIARFSFSRDRVSQFDLIRVRARPFEIHVTRGKTLMKIDRFVR